MRALNAALEYAAHGWRVVPITPGKKFPPMKSWQDAATVSHDTIHDWWDGQYRDFGVGIATGRVSSVVTGNDTQRYLFVLDIDIADGKHGDESLADLEAEHGRLPDTYEVLTGSGGRHLYFYSDVEIRNDQASRLGLHLDVRGEGGQVLAPPTVHPTTRQPYEQELSSLIAPAMAPDWLIELLTRPVETAAARRQTAPYEGTARPGDLYNSCVSWPELLEPDGARFIAACTGADGSAYEMWARPGLPDNDLHTSASLYYRGSDVLKCFTPNWTTPSGITLQEGRTYDRWGYYVATRHRGDFAAAARAIAREYGMPDPDDHMLEGVPEYPPLRVVPELVEVETQFGQPVHDLSTCLVDWNTLFTRDAPGEDWLVPKLVARGRGHALYAGAKTGKSFVALNAIAHAVQGRCWLTGDAIPPIRCLYLDYEMTEQDLLERLEQYGFDGRTDLNGLRYALLPRLHPLDTREGGEAVLRAALAEDIDLVVVDTTGRAVAGDENDARTYQDFYMHTGMRLKQVGIAMMRCDHSGKDKDRGQRGSSAKNDDVDVVYELTRLEDGHNLKATHKRMGWVPDITRLGSTDTDGVVSFTTETATWNEGTAALAEWLDQHGVPAGASRRKIRSDHADVLEGARTAGLTVRNGVIDDAVRYRKTPRPGHLDPLDSDPLITGHTSGHTAAPSPGHAIRVDTDNPTEINRAHTRAHPGPPSTANGVQRGHTKYGPGDPPHHPGLF